MDFLNNNLMTIEKYNRELFGYISEQRYNRDTVVSGVESVGGKNVLFAIKNEVLYQLDSMYDSSIIIKNFKDQIDGNYNSIYIMFGFGNGMFVRSLLEKCGPEIRVFVYEPVDDIFLTALENYDLADIFSDKRFEILIKGMETDKKHLFFYLSERINYSDHKGKRVYSYMNYPVIFDDEYKYFRDAVTEVDNSIKANRSVFARYGKLYVRNTFLNIPYLLNSKSIASLYGYLPDDLPAIVVSAGPSLSQSFETLRKAKGRALILAVDSSLGVLIKQGIIPDMFVTVDANKEIGSFSDPVVKDIPTMVVMEARPEAMYGHNAPIFFAADNNEFLHSIVRKTNKIIPLLSTGGCVANDATSFAEILGLKTIVFVGQDLAYIGKQTHVSGSLRAGLDIDTETTKCFVEGLSGEMVESSQEFVLYREWFEREIRRRPDVTFINSTPQGARIHGAIEMPLEDVLKQYCEKTYDIANMVAQAAPMYEVDEKKELAQFDNYAIEAFSEIKRKLRSGIRKYDEMLGLVIERKYASNHFRKLYQDAVQISSEVENSPYSYFGINMVQQEIGESLDTVNEILEDEYEELKAAIRKGTEYLELLYRGFEQAERFIEELKEEREKYDVVDIRTDLELIIDNLLNVSSERSVYINNLVDASGKITTLKLQAENKTVLKALRKKIKMIRHEMFFQRLAAAVVLFAITGDEELYAEAQKGASEIDNPSFRKMTCDFLIENKLDDNLIEKYITFFCEKITETNE